MNFDYAFGIYSVYSALTIGSSWFDGYAFLKRVVVLALLSCEPLDLFSGVEIAI